MPPINEGLITMYSPRFSEIMVLRSLMDLHSSSAAIGTGTMLLSFFRSSKFATGSSTYSNRYQVIFLPCLEK